MVRFVYVGLCTYQRYGSPMFKYLPCLLVRAGTGGLLGIWRVDELLLGPQNNDLFPILYFLHELRNSIYISTAIFKISL